MNLKEIHHIYFIGIGGIGMSALAKYFHKNGKKVGGYDKTATKITATLQASGIHVHFDDSIENIPLKFQQKETTLVVFTPAISKENRELNFFQCNGFKVKKRAEILGDITQNSFCFAIAGTHGKTTISSILGHILQPYHATSFLGGISKNYHSNLILGNDEVSVIEADEFDRSFLTLSPNIACISSTDADHLDIFGRHTELKQSFQEFADKVTDQLFVAKGIDIEGTSYAVESDADYEVQKVIIENGNYIFNIKTPSELVEHVMFALPGKHNLMNALAAFAMAHFYGVPSQNIKESLRSFKGVERRFSYRIKTESLILIDDYAHHPTEIKAIHQAVEEMYPREKYLVIFQPHLFTRTQDFAEEFAKALSKFDDVKILEIYPARELPIQGVNSEWLLSKINSKNKSMTSEENLASDIQKSEAKIVVMLGAGDIGMMVDRLVPQLHFKEKV